MDLRRTTVHDRAEWASALADLPRAHVLQAWEWGDFKAGYGWEPERLVWRFPDGRPAAAAQVLARTLRVPGIGLRRSVLYAPRGPVLDWAAPGVAEAVLRDLRDQARRPGVIQVKIDPDLPLGYGAPGSDEAASDPIGERMLGLLPALGFQPSPEQVQFRNTFVLDLRPEEGRLLAHMKQKTRYNVRLAERHVVRVREGAADDIPLLFRMYAETSLRDGFVIRPAEYYQDVWGRFMRAGLAQPLLAEVDAEPVAALIVYRLGPRAWYLYGMSRDLHRDKMPNYLLQWEAMRWSKAAGCTEYDLWGAPDHLDPNDPMWGVYRFKEGLGGRLVRTLGAWDATARPMTYRLYHGLLPALLGLLRRRGLQATRQSLE
ncbi:MAG: peptidoglycan bridge formation glycyltransferase FemA/FemB family protein [Anaerolineales bacterium]|nr:peptidoglycan bridge formation glycyltransferase FemA/FemB family protein [Anaerolineales bacterium]